MTGDDMARIAKCGYRQASCEKLHFDAHDAFTSAYFLELGLPRAQLEKNIPSLFTDPACGNVQWYELNAAAAGLTAAPIPQGQQVLIVIGEGLDKARLEEDLRQLVFHNETDNCAILIAPTLLQRYNREK